MTISKLTLITLACSQLFLGLSDSRGADLTGWTPPAIGKIDPTGGRHGTPALSVATTIEGQNQPWISPSQPIQGKYLRASAWMKVRDLYYRDLSFFAYGSVEFLNKAGKSLGEQSFIRSRELMLTEPLAFQKMMGDKGLLTLDWRYGERTVAVPPDAVAARIKFGFSFRTVGQAWLDDLKLTFSDQAPPSENAAASSAAIPPVEIRLRTPQYALEKDPLGPFFYPGEDAVFCAQAPSVKLSGTGVMSGAVADSEGYVLWRQDIPLSTAKDWATFTVPKTLAEQWKNRYLCIKFTLRDGGQLAAKSQVSFGFIDDFAPKAPSEGMEERFIAHSENFERTRYWMGQRLPMAAVWLHIPNLWKDASRPPDLVAAAKANPYYGLADDLHRKNEGVVILVGDNGKPDPIPAFSNLGMCALMKPESLKTFAVAAARRYPYAKYWRMFCEQYAPGVPGYAEAFVSDEKAFHDGIKSVLPNAVIIQDNNSVMADMVKLNQLGLFNYCDAIDPHLYGSVDDRIFGSSIFAFQTEQKQLAALGVHKRWILLESAPFSGGGARGITQDWVAQELPKNFSSFFALGGEKTDFFTGIFTNPEDPYLAGASGGLGGQPTVNYFSMLRLTEKLGLTPSVGTFALGGQRVQYNRFADDKHTVLLAWSRIGENTLRIDTASPVRVTDNIRTSQTLRPNAGSCYVTMGMQPVYIEGANDMKVSLAGQSEPAAAASGGILAGGETTIDFTSPDPSAGTVTVLLPSGVTAASTTEPLRQGRATFLIHCPEGNDYKGATLGFLSGSTDAPNGLVLHHYESVMPIRAEIWPDAAIRGNRPRYIVRITNENPTPARGRVAAEAPVSDGERPEEVEQSFDVKPHSKADLLFEFAPASMEAVRAQERNYPAVASVFPDGSGSFVIRDQVSFQPVPKVTPGLRIDGDLSDWPADQPSYELGRPDQYVALKSGATPGDIHAALQIAWDRANLYFAVKVRGRDAESSQGIKLVMTNAEDKRAPYYEEKNTYRSYEFLRGPDGVKLEAKSRTPSGEGVWYAARSVPGGVDYEIDIPVPESANAVQIDPNRWVKLSAAVLDADGKGYWQWYGGVREPNNYGAYGDFQLAAYGKDEHGQLYGCRTSGDGRETDGYVGLGLLPDGGRVLVRNSAGKNDGEAIVQDAGGRELRRFPIKTGHRVHSVQVDQDGRLAVGDREQGINFYSLKDGLKISVGPLQSLYPDRVHIEYRTQGVTQDKEGNYFVSVERKRRTTPGWGETRNETLFSGITMYTRQGDEVKEVGLDMPYTMFGTIHGFGGMGEAAGKFLYAESIACDSAGKLWVSDIDAKTIQVLDRTGPRAFARLPLVYDAMPAGLYPCHMQALQDGNILFWNADRMAVAQVAGDKIKILKTANLTGKVVDLKVAGENAVTVDHEGNVATFPGIWGLPR